MLKMPYFCPFAAHFGGFEGVFSFITDNSAILCPDKTEVADMVSFKGSIVQRIDFEKGLGCCKVLTTFFGKKIFGSFG